MSLHFHDQDLVPEVAGLSSELIVPWNMYTAATVAVRENKPFIQLSRSLLKSRPFEQYTDINAKDDAPSAGRSYWLFLINGNQYPIHRLFFASIVSLFGRVFPLRGTLEKSHPGDLNPGLSGVC